MTKLFSKLSSLFLLVCLLLTGCINEVDVPEFKLIKQTVADNAVVDTLLTEIVLTYSNPIVLDNANLITINGETTHATTANMLLKISLSLAPDHTYILTIPSGAITDNYQQTLPDFTITFSTIKRPVVDTLSFVTRSALVTPNPSQEANNVYQFLRQNYGKMTISGVHANVNWNTNEAQWVYKHTGKYPALNCFDYVHLLNSPANWIDYGQTQVVEDWWNNNGLIAANWHWNVPSSEGSSTVAFYTTQTTFDIRRAVVPGNWEYDVVISDLSKLAGYLGQLRDKQIPVIWRPLHEASGGWFWWGAQGPTPYIALWRLVFDQLVNVHQLNNLIWVWTTETNDAAWYPGDEYVDIIGRDIYNQSSGTNIASQFNDIASQYSNQIVTLSEFGNVASVESQWTNGARWSWFMPWYDYDRTLSVTSSAFDLTTHTFADISYWSAAWTQDYVISRDEMPDLK